MRPDKPNNKKIAVPILILIVILAVFVPQHQVEAFWPFSNIVESTLGTLITEITSFIRNAILEAIGWAATLLDSLIKSQPVSGVFVVDQSWKIIRDFVNMFFILVLIVMAFGTIFDIKGYTWLSGRPPMFISFLIAALLINFSLVIGQYIIGIANGLNSVFLKTIQGAGGVSGNFMTGLNSVGLTTAGETGLLDASGSLVVTAIFSVIFLTIVFLAFLAAAIFSLFRMVILWFLLIVSPIAWLGYALPNLRGKTWSEWWKHFFCWCFFLPYYVFFLMFAVIFIKNKDALSKSSLADFNTNSGLFGGGFTTVNDVLFYALSLIFLIGGLAAARKLSCATGTGIKMVMGGKDGKGGIEGFIRRYAPGAAYVRAVGAGAKEGLKAKGEEIKEKGVFGIGGAQAERLRQARWAEKFGFGAARGRREEQLMKEVATQKGEYEKIVDTSQLRKLAGSGSSIQRLAARETLKDRGELNAQEIKETYGMYGGKGTLPALKFARGLDFTDFSAEERKYLLANLPDPEVSRKLLRIMADKGDLKSAEAQDLTRYLTLFTQEGDKKEFLDKVQKSNFLASIEAQIRSGFIKVGDEDEVLTIAEDATQQAIEDIVARGAVEKIKGMSLDKFLELPSRNIRQLLANPKVNRIMGGKITKDNIAGIQGKVDDERLRAIDTVLRQRRTAIEQEEATKLEQQAQAQARGMQPLVDSIERLIQEIRGGRG